MSEYLQKIVYLTQAQYNTLKTNGTVGGYTGINDNYLYFVTDEAMSASDLSDDFILPVNKGGTGKTQFTSGSLLVGNGQNALTEIGATDQNTPNTIVKRDSSGNFSAGKATLTEAKIGSISIAANKLTAVTSIDTNDSNGLLAYKPTSWTGVSNVQWGVGTINAQGVIRSNSTDLLHSRSGANSVILDAGNYASYIKYVNLYEARASTTTLNKTANYVAAGAMFHLVASSSTSTTDNGKTPMGDANILQMNWDNNGGYDAQLGIHTTDNRMEFRSRASQKQAWREVVTSTPGTAAGGETQPVYINTSGVATAIPYTIAQSVPADAVFTDHYAWGDITGKPTKITLTGAVTGNVTLGNGENSIATTVNHNHDDRYKIASGVITLGSNTITPVTSVNGHQGASVNVTASDLGLASALKYVGTVSSLPTATDSTTYSAYNNGDVITVSNKEYAYVKGSNAAGSSWVELGDEGSYKLKQTAFTNSTGTADGSNTSTTFIYSFSQDANGVITDIKTRKLPTYNNYSHPTGDGNLHVPATGTDNNGKFLKAGSTAGSLSWATLAVADISDISTTYYKLDGSNTGTKLCISTQSAAYTNQIQFMNSTTKKGSIGTDNTGILGLYAASKIVLRPELDASTKGVEITSSAMYPTASIDLGTSTAANRWGIIYAKYIKLLHTQNSSGEVQITYSTTIDFSLTVGTGNENHGLYDAKKSDWVLYAGADNKWILNINSINHLNANKVVDGTWPTGTRGVKPTATTTDGNTTYSGGVVGKSILTLGNNKVGGNNASAVDDNAQGQLNIYSSGSTMASLTAYAGDKTRIYPEEGISLPYNKIGMMFRADSGSYYTYFAYENSGNEALVAATQNSVTSFIFVNGESYANVAAARWTKLTGSGASGEGNAPGLQIKQNCVSIGELIPSSTNATYKLNVNGTSNFKGNMTSTGSFYTSGRHISLISGGEADQFIDFAYAANPTASTAPGASWRIGALNSGSGDSNYFVIQTGGSATSATTWNNALRLGMNTYDAGFGGNVYPLTNNNKTLGTSSLKWNNVYATSFTGNLVGNADTATNATNHIARTDNPHNVTATQLGLGNVENTKLSTWAGSTNLTTLGTITTGTWNGTAIANNKLANSSLTVGNKTISLGETGKLKEIQASPQYHVGDTSSCTYVLVTINKETSWMLSFTLRLYQGYQATDIQISGYNYGGNHWYSPAAVILGSTSTAKFNVYFGYTGNYKLWVAVDGSSYTGASVVDITNGYTQIDFENAITLTKVSTLPETLQVTKEVYRPWYRNETVSNATTAGNITGTLALANLTKGDANTALMGKGSSTAPAYVSVSPSISITAGTADNAPKVNLTVLGVSGTTAQELTKATTGVYGATKLYDGVDSTSTVLAATANAVKTAYDKANSITAESLGLSKALRFVGITTTDMTGGTATNHTYTGTPAGISDYTPIVGDVVINSTKQDEWVCTAVSETTYTWERLGSDTSYKIVQSAVSDPTAASTTSTTFIDTISQDANGVISATKNTLPTASTSVAGIIKIGTGSTNAMAGNTTVTNVSYTATTDNQEYPILMKYSTGSTTTTAGVRFANTANKAVTINPANGTVTAQGGFYGSTFSGTANTANQLGKQTITDSNLDKFISDGSFKYSWAGGNNQILSVPTGTDAFGLMTFKTADNWTGQIFVSTNNLPGIYWRNGLTTSGSLVANWTRLANGNANIYYGESTTAADTAIKDVTCLHYHTLNVGDILVVKFTNANSANEPQLNVNSTGNKLIRASYSGDIVSLSSTTQIRDTCMFIYDGTYWIQMSTDCVKQMVTTSSESVWRSVMVSASNNASESFTPSQMFAETYVAHNVKFQASTGTLRATKFKGTEFKLEYEHVDKAYMTWNNTDQSIDFIFV